MADPIIQNQNGQDPQVQTQTNDAELDFNLNIPNNEEATNENMEISLNFDDVEEIKPEIETETIIENTQEAETEKNINDIEETQQAEIIKETPEIIPEVIVEKRNEDIEKSDLNEVETEPEIIKEIPSELIIENIVEDKPELTIEETPEVIVEEAKENLQENEIIENIVEDQPEITIEEAPETLIENTEIPKENENRLEKEDALVEKKLVEPESEIIQNIEKKVIPEIQTESLNILNEPTEIVQETIEATTVDNPTLAVETTAIEQNLPSKSNLEQDYKIIQQIQETSTNPVEFKPIVNTIPTQNEINLDDLLSSPTPNAIPTNNPEITNNQNIINNPVTPIQETPAIMSIQGYSIPPIIEETFNKIQKPMNRKILVNFGLGIIFLIVGGFMFKTMYPLEYQKFMGKEQVKETIALVEEPIEQITETGEIADTNENSLFENPSLNNYHGAALEDTGINNDDDFNAFKDFEQDTVKYDDETIEKIQNYVDIGKKQIVISKKNKDDETTKLALFLYKKASSLLLDIENEIEISIDELDKQLKELESYLQKITGEIVDEEIKLQEPSIPSPEDFFGGENNTSEDKNELSIPTEDTSSNQETEDETQNIPGEQDPIDSTNNIDR